MVGVGYTLTVYYTVNIRSKEKECNGLYIENTSRMRMVPWHDRTK
jgi:hypothetical protein